MERLSLLNWLRVLCRVGYLVFVTNLMFIFGTRHWANFFNRYRWHIRCFDKFNLYSILCQLEQFVFGFATVSGLLLLLWLLCFFPSFCCVCGFSLGKLDINNVQIKSSPQCGRQNWWRVMVSICCASLYAQFSSSSIYVFMRWPYWRWAGARGVRGLCVVTRLGKLPVEHWDTRLPAIRFVVISQQEQFVSDFWTLYCERGLSYLCKVHKAGKSFKLTQNCMRHWLSLPAEFATWRTLRMRNVFVR